jgi:hypothetical protein
MDEHPPHKRRNSPAVRAGIDAFVYCVNTRKQCVTHLTLILERFYLSTGSL